MQKAKALYKLSRPLSSFSGLLAVVLGGYVSGTGEWGKVAIAAVATILISAAANAWNDYLDIEIDKINQPQRPLPAGKVTPKEAVIFSIILTTLSLVFAATISLPAFAIAFSSTILLYVYSWRLKSTVLLGNIIVAMISALSVVFGGIAAGNPWPTLWLAAIIFSAILGREILKTMADYEGDLHQHCRTVSTVWGKRWARIIFFLLTGWTMILMMTPYLFNVYNPLYAYIVAFGVYPVIVYIIVRVSRERSGPQLEQLSQLMKYDFLIWFVAVLLGTNSLV